MTASFGESEFQLKVSSILLNQSRYLFKL